MLVRSIGTREYGADIGKQLERRLNAEIQSFKMTEQDRDGFKFWELAYNKDDQDGVNTAVALLLLRNLQHRELVRIIGERHKAFLVEDKRLLLISALKTARAVEQISPIKRRVGEHFAVKDDLILEGFMRFCMKDVLTVWRRAADRAAEELLLRREFREFIHLLQRMATLQSGHSGEVHLHLKPDGSYTLCDADEFLLNCGDCEGLIGLLIGLSPERILVHDYANAPDSQIIEIIDRVFEGRVSFLS